MADHMAVRPCLRKRSAVGPTRHLDFLPRNLFHGCIGHDAKEIGNCPATLAPKQQGDEDVVPFLVAATPLLSCSWWSTPPAPIQQQATPFPCRRCQPPGFQAVHAGTLMVGSPLQASPLVAAPGEPPLPHARPAPPPLPASNPADAVELRRDPWP
jgi:hypothetical protein